MMAKQVKKQSPVKKPDAIYIVSGKFGNLRTDKNIVIKAGEEITAKDFTLLANFETYLAIGAIIKK